MNGTIYTEKHQASKIKYLKVVRDSAPNHYTLYGNRKGNVMECRTGFVDRVLKYSDERDCIMIGGRGNDKFIYNPSGSSFNVQDFKTNEGDGDRLIIDMRVDSYIINESGNNLSLVLGRDEGENKTNYYYLSLKGPSVSEVEGWVDMIKNPEEYEIQDRLNNPIKLSNSTL